MTRRIHMSRLYAGRGVTQGSRSVSRPYKDSYDSSAVTVHTVGDKPTVILYTTFIAIVVSHIQRIGRQRGKTTLHNGQSRSSRSAEQGNVYSSSVYAIPVAYSFLHVPGMYVWSTLSAEYDIDQPSVVASPAR